MCFSQNDLFGHSRPTGAEVKADRLRVFGALQTGDAQAAFVVLVFPER
jgi:hypothetical protein